MLAAKEKTISSSLGSTFTWPPRGSYVRTAASPPTTMRRNPFSARHFTELNFKTRKSEKSPIGSKVKSRSNPPWPNQHPRGKTLGENVVQLRRLHLAPGMSQYRGYFVPGGTDPDGEVVIAAAVGIVGGVSFAYGCVMQYYWAAAKVFPNDDKLRHCWMNCKISRACMKGWAIVMSEAKETWDVRIGQTHDLFESFNDDAANAVGRECAGWETVIPVVSWGTGYFRDSCADCCRSKMTPGNPPNPRPKPCPPPTRYKPPTDRYDPAPWGYGPKY